MRNFIIGIFFSFIFSSQIFAALDCAIDLYRAPTSGQGQGAVLGGWAKGGKSPVLVTLKNAGISYTAPTDRNGRWSIFFRLLSRNVTVESWVPEIGEYVDCKDLTL